MTKYIINLTILILSISSCQSQNTNSTTKIVGGSCEGCEAIFEYGDIFLTSVDTLPNFEEAALKIKITGKVLEKDGKTPAEGVILYIYQTNREGLYISNKNAKGWERRHGSLRGWIKTGKDGIYTFYTFRPAAYPNGLEPEHIHITVKEPNKNEYYIDEFSFDDDPLLTASKRKSMHNRGGSGIVLPIVEKDIRIANRNIILGLNIPDYD
jgi:protocatechuate 3,4-dioxygenase beta subunit